MPDPVLYEFLFLVTGVLAVILALVLAFRSEASEERDQGTGDAETSAFHEQTTTTLLSVFQDFYRQEVASEEDVHRTLPFFATALGLIITALNVVAAQLPGWETVRATCSGDKSASIWPLIWCGWPAGLSASLLLLSAVSILNVLRFLLQAIVPRDYDRVGPEQAYLDRAKDLIAFHQARGLAGEALDKEVNLDIRNQLLSDFTRILPHNREISRSRYNYRARAFRFLLGSLFLVLIATIIILVTSKAGLLPVKAALDD